MLDNEQDAAPLILDCDYDVDPNERGFVLKWLLNGSRIFQWIPNQWPSYGSVSDSIAELEQFFFCFEIIKIGFLISLFSLL